MHRPVLENEAVAALAVKAGGLYVDGTFGRGGHSLACLLYTSPSPRDTR